MSQSPSDGDFERAIAALAAPGVAIGFRRILPGDENALLEEERASLASSLARRRASGAARIVARQLLEQFGYRDRPIPRGAEGEPVWPAGLSGSLSHDDTWAVAAVGKTLDCGSIGIDVEPATPLPREMISLIFTPAELSHYDASAARVGRLIFAAKEAVYKANFPLARSFLEFQDIEVDLDRFCASVRGGLTFSIRYCTAPSIVVLATGETIGR